jgi:subtilisin-like proprotein convertase family protein
MSGLSGTGNSITANFSGSATSGTLSVTATRNGCGPSIARTLGITVNSVRPQPSSISGNNSVCQSSTNNNYSVTNDPSATSYTWTYSGTGATITGTTNSVSINFSASATSGILSVVANNTCGSSSASTLPVTINPLPAIVTVTGGGTFCGSALLSASNGSSGTIYFQGTNANGVSTATPSATATVSSSGTYYFRALSSAGCWGPSGSATVTINSNPTVSLTASPTPICFGLNSTLTASNSGGSVGGSINMTNNTDVNIPDNNPIGASSPIFIPAGILTAANANSILISIAIDHGRVGDLTATLTGPCGTTTVFDGGTSTLQLSSLLGTVYEFSPGGTNTFPQSAGGLFAAFVNGSITYNFSVSGITLPCDLGGTWTLKITDAVSGTAAGTLRSWSIQIPNALGYSTVFTGPGTFGSIDYTGTNNTSASASVTPLVAGTNSYTATTTDANGCSATSSPVVVTVRPAPSLVAPADATLNTSDDDLGNCSTTYSWAHPGVNTLCPTTLTVAYTAGSIPAPASLPSNGPVTPGSAASATFSAGVTIVTYTATDQNNNTATTSFTVTVADDELPDITCSPDVTVPNTIDQCGTTVILTAPATSDNCGVASVTNDHPSASFDEA